VPRKKDSSTGVSTSSTEIGKEYGISTLLSSSRSIRHNFTVARNDTDYRQHVLAYFSRLSAGLTKR